MTKQPIYHFIYLLLFLFSSSCKSPTQPMSETGQESSPSFSKHRIHDAFIAEGVAVADVDKDGDKDILAGFHWFEAPDWQIHDIQPPQSFDYKTAYSSTFVNFTMDVNEDGWPDLIRIDTPGEGVYWYENPKGEAKHWPTHFIDSSACNEAPMLVDLDQDGRKDLVFAHEDTGTMIWFRSPKVGRNSEWEVIPISKEKALGTNRYAHGLGFGDVNSDGRPDIIIRQGWWEAPSDPTEVPWDFHEVSLGEACSQMYTVDFDKDGDQDIISASAHQYGIWWHEQVKEKGNNTFKRHLIDSTFSQSHGAALADINGDGLPDFITGKRFFAHNGKDPGGKDAAVLYWFELQREPDGSPNWVPHLIDSDSGVGLQVLVEDLNGDGRLDIISSNKKGVQFFLQE